MSRLTSNQRIGIGLMLVLIGLAAIYLAVRRLGPVAGVTQQPAADTVIVTTTAPEPEPPAKHKPSKRQKPKPKPAPQRNHRDEEF